jgi:hypothetical protein
MIFTPKIRNSASLACLTSAVLLSACAKPPTPVSVAQFMDNPRLLEATMVRCAQNRAEMKYQSECVNARDAVDRLAAAEEQASRQQMETQSERKRQALRRTQEAAAEARRRALEAQRQQEEAEYLGLFEELPASGETTQDETAGSVQPQETASTPVPAKPPATLTAPEMRQNTEAPAGDEPVASDLQSIREELRRRKESQQQN